MHESVMAFVSTCLTPKIVTGKRILEVGSLNVNGTVRPGLEQLHPESYVGVDIVAGPCVDVVCDGAKLPKLSKGLAPFDVVLCLETLEHAENWRGLVGALKQMLAPGGYMVLTCRSLGKARHDHPNDYWRFTRGHIGGAFRDMDIVELVDDKQEPGVLLFARKPSGAFVQCVLADLHPDRAPT